MDNYYESIRGNKPFRPIMGSDEKIQSAEYHEGLVYFATDSGKIYLDAHDENKLLMGGGGASILYAYDSNVEQEPGDLYLIHMDTIEGNVRPKEGDLIVNQGNNCFYKIIGIREDQGVYVCNLIAVSGSGGGPGPGPGENYITLKTTDINRRKTYIYGQPSYITVTAIAQLDSYVTITFEILHQDKTKTVIDKEVISGETLRFDIGSLLKENYNDVTIIATGSNSGSTSLKYLEQNAVRLALRKTNRLSSAKILTSAQDLEVEVEGKNLEKELTLVIDGVDVLTKYAGPAVNNEPITLTMPKQSHGVHQVTVRLKATISGSSVYAPDLNYEFAWVEEGNTLPLIWLGESPNTVINYSVASIEYMVYNPEYEESVPFEITFMKDGDFLYTRSIAYNSSQMHVWNITDYTVDPDMPDGTPNVYAISCGPAQKDIEFLVIADTSRPNMGIYEQSLYLNLDSTGRSNSETSTSRQTWSYTNDKGKNIKVAFSGFNWYNNGWVEDQDKISALRISNGASISIPLDEIMKEASLSQSYTFEFQFKIRNVKSYKSLVSVTRDTSGSDSDPKGSVSVAKDYLENRFLDFYNGAGFCFGPSDAFFSGGGKLPFVRYKEDELINVSIVLDHVGVNGQTNAGLIYFYLNGIMSKVEEFNTTNNIKIETNNLIIGSNSCDIDLYKVRVYTTSLNYNIITRNFIADKKSIDIYDVNQITVNDGKGNQIVDFQLMEAYNISHPDNCTLPYAVVEVNDPTNLKDELPWIKGGKVNVNVTFVNPSLDRAYEIGELETSNFRPKEFSITEFYEMSAPSFIATDVEMDVQGTSSQGYPRRNYKLKFKKASTWSLNGGPHKEIPKEKIKKFQIDNKYGENKFTWKADYMDSSSTHNTGFASWVKQLYTKHPLENLGFPPDSYHRTTIYGFPMVVFQKKQDGSYKFIGRYNFNYDKDCGNVIGFESEEPHPYVPGKNINEIAECWEFCNNQGTRCSFTQVDFDEVNSQGDRANKLAVPEFFELRYHHDADELEAWCDSTDPTDQAKALDKYKNLETVCKWVNSTQTDPVEGSPNYFTDENDTPENRLKKFRDEFTQHFDLEYCLVYFIATEVLVCYDSRGKNMMLATFGPQSVEGNYIWYPIFYDIDTQLGLDNSGVPLWDYYVNPTEEKVFSTSNSVLWNNFFVCFRAEIEKKYAQLRKNGLTYSVLDGYYKFDPNTTKSYAMKGQRPLAIYNCDEFYKYIAPSIPGYGFINTSGEVGYSSEFYYCAQGTRDLQRELFFNNRFYFEDSKYHGGQFTNEEKASAVQSRINANDPDQTSDITVGNTETYPEPYDTLNYVNITPYLNSYGGIAYDTSTNFSTEMSKSGETFRINIPGDAYNIIINSKLVAQGQLLYIFGKQYISDFGDLSRFYPNELKLGGANRVKRLLIGSDLPLYKNNYFRQDANINFDTIDGYPLLEEMNLSRLSSYSTEVNLFNSEKLKMFRALHSAITSVILPDGVQLESYYLPETVYNLKLVKTNKLTNILTVEPTFSDSEWPKGLYMEGITNYLNRDISSAQIENLNTTFQSIYLNDDSFGINSYKFLDTIVKIKQKIINEYSDNTSYSKNLSVNAANVDWSPYERLEKDAQKYNDIEYFELTNHYTFKPYSFSTDEQWKKDCLNGRLFKKNYDPALSPITDLSLLDIFIDSYNGITPGDHFHNSTGNNNTLPYLSGIMYVNNDLSNPIDEVMIKNYYNKYYPGLEIYVANVKKSITINYVEVRSTGEEYIWETQKYSTTDNLDDYLSPINTTPSKPNYDFMGWSISQTAVTPDEKQPTDYTIREIANIVDSNELTFNFYVIYNIHSYKIEFFDYDSTPLLDSTGQPIILYIPFGQKLYAPDIIPVRSSDGLGKYEVYDFAGFSVSPNDRGPVVDLSTLTSIKDQKFYAYYERIADIRKVVHYEYFKVLPYDSMPGTYQLQPAKILAGKITIPTRWTDGKPISIIAGFSAADGSSSGTSVSKPSPHEITHVFAQFEGNDSLKIIAQDCFNYCSTLKYFDFIGFTELIEIQGTAFRNCNFSNIEFNEKLLLIGQNAFAESLSRQEVLRIPSSVGTLSVAAFNYIAKPSTEEQIYQIIIGSQDNPSNIDFSKASDTTHAFFAQNKDSTHKMIYNTITIYTNRYTSISDYVDSAQRITLEKAIKGTSWQGANIVLVQPR